MNEIENPRLYSVIKNTIGFYYVYATHPERVEESNGTQMIRIDDSEDDMYVIETITAAVYTHLRDGGWLDVGGE